MNRTPTSSRAVFGLLLFTCATTLFAAGGLLAAIFAPNNDSPQRLAFLVVIVALLAVIRSFVLSQLPSLLRNARWQLHRPLIVWELVLVVALVEGAWIAPGLMVSWPLFIISAPFACLLAIQGAKGGASPLPE